jgi:ferredoxin
MPPITINDQTVDAEAGETLLHTARRHGAHIGFVCGGRGLCHTCECRITAGMENLSSPNEVEYHSMNKTRRIQGYRLACQTRIIGQNPIEAISTIELMRRHAASVVAPPEGTRLESNISRLFINMTRFTMNDVTRLPYILWNIYPQMQSKPLQFSELWQIFGDTQRVIQNNIFQQKTLPAPDTPPQIGSDSEEA